MRLPQVMRIAKREYVESVRKKSFVFGLIATPVLLLMMVVLPLVSGALFDADEARIAVVDPTGEIGPRLAGTDWPSGDGARTRPEFVVYESNAPSPETLDALVAAGEYSGWLRVPEDFEQTGKFEYRSESVTKLSPSGRNAAPSRISASRMFAAACNCGSSSPP